MRYKTCGRQIRPGEQLVGLALGDNIWWNGRDPLYRRGSVATNSEGGYYNSCGFETPPENHWLHLCRECAQKQGLIW